MKEKLLPHLELQALRVTAGVTVGTLSTETGIPHARLNAYLRGCRDLSIDEILSVRNYLTDRIKQQVAGQNLADQDPELMRFLCDCKLTSAEIQGCVRMALPVSALLATVSSKVMTHEDAARIIRDRLNAGEQATE